MHSLFKQQTLRMPHLTVVEHGQVDDGAREPQLEQALAHGRHTLVEHAKQAEALLRLADSHSGGVLLLLQTTLCPLNG